MQKTYYFVMCNDLCLQPLLKLKKKSATKSKKAITSVYLKQLTYVFKANHHKKYNKEKLNTKTFFKTLLHFCQVVQFGEATEKKLVGALLTWCIVQVGYCILQRRTYSSSGKNTSRGFLIPLTCFLGTSEMTSTSLRARSLKQLNNSLMTRPPGGRDPPQVQ